MPDKTYTPEEAQEWLNEWYTGDVPEWYILIEETIIDTLWIYWRRNILQETVEHQQKIIDDRIRELRLKLIAWTITEEEREELKLLIG